ncbi:MAG: hypothetical protein ACK4QW_18215, partial [Alphaproteobacteria bacterium]
MALAGAVAWAAADAGAVTLITLQPDGSVSVRIGDRPAVTVPAATAKLLQDAIVPGADPAGVAELLAGGACIAPGDARMMAAVASYALSLASEDLSSQVVLGAQACNADVSDEIEVAAGPGAPAADVGIAGLAAGGITGAGGA